MERKRTRMGYLLLLPSTLLIAVLIVYPTIKTVYDSFFEIRTQTAALGARFVGLGNYVQAFQHQHYIDTRLWTLVFTLGSIAVELVNAMALTHIITQPTRWQGIIRH